MQKKVSKEKKFEKIIEKSNKLIKILNYISIINAVIYFIYIYIDSKMGMVQVLSYIFNEETRNIINNIYQFIINYCKIEIYICIILNIIYHIFLAILKYVLNKIQLKNLLYLNNHNINNEIYEYLKSKEKRPFLITGEWGSGKTYTINNFFKNYYKYNKQKIYKISCFGIENRTALINEMKNIFEKEDNSLSKKLLNIINKIPIFGDFLCGLLKNDYDIKNIPENSIFIFDDFERIAPYGMKKINENIEFQILSKYNIVIGVINELIDRYNMKVFILCNTNEINKGFVYNVFEEKLSCKRFEIEADSNVFTNLTRRALNSYVFFDEDEKKKINEFFKIISPKMEDYWKNTGIQNIRILSGIISAFIELIKKYTWVNDTDYRDIFFSIYVYHILYYTNKLDSLNEIEEGENIYNYFKKKMEKLQIECGNPLFEIDYVINKWAIWAGTGIASSWIIGKNFTPDSYYYITEENNKIEFKSDALD